MDIRADLPATALCYSEGDYRIWLWADHICSIVAFERFDGKRWERIYDLEVPQQVRANAKRFFGRGGSFISEKPATERALLARANPGAVDP